MAVANSSFDEIRKLAPERDPGAFVVGGVTPKMALAPTNASEALAVVEASQNLACIPFGTGSRVHVGGSPSRYDFALSTAGMTGVVRYEPADLVATFRAGTPWLEVQKTLGEHGQWLPWEPEFGGPKTFGGALATNIAGPTQDGFGLPRDRILQLLAITGYGKKITVGAPVVKSVAGYDIHRLYCGSWGTLGLIVEATIRTEPMATWARRTVQLNGWEELAERAEDADRLGAALASFVVRVDDGMSATYSLWGPDAAVAWACDRVGGDDIAPPQAEPHEALLRASTAPADSLRLAKRLAGENVRLTLRPVSGIVWVETDNTQVARTIEIMEEEGAEWRVERGVTDRHWSEPEAIALMRQIKATFDPNGLFNPGRFAGGI